MKEFINENFRHFLHGGDYNPEQWINVPGIWDEDMRLMKLANCNEMSVGIFSWAMLEPQDGVYNFEWLDEILDRIYENGGRVFLATPSAARPHWMADQHPEVLRVNNTGHRNHFGFRHNHCYTSPYYRKKVAAINEKLAERYGKHPAVIGWHISNEYGGTCFCDLCVEAFRDWLRKEYDNDIEKLNHDWWMTFWSHQYDSFDQIEPPLDYGENNNPVRLNWRRFVTHQTADFIKNEVQAIRKFSDLPVTTNYMVHFMDVDYFRISEEVDFISLDSYPYWHKPGEDGHFYNAIEHAATMDLFRAFKDKPWVLMESTPSVANWHGYPKLKKPGMHKLAAMQAVAHGSDAVQYFQWRKSRGNRESQHGAVVDHVGNENTRTFREVAEVGATLQKIEEVLGTKTKVRAAVIYDTEVEWAIEGSDGFTRFGKKYYATVLSFYAEFWKRAIDVDIVSARADLSKYDLVVAPMLYAMRKEVVESLISFVKDGGTLVSGYLSGYVDQNDLFYLHGLPAEGLKEVFGVWNEEIDSLYPEEKNFIEADGKQFEVVDFCEHIHALPGAEVVARYASDFFAGEPAVVKNRFGKGTAFYVAARDTGAYKKHLFDQILKELQFESNIPNPPEGVTAHTRTDGEKVYLFVENYNDAEVKVDLGGKMRNLETDSVEEGTLCLEKFGVRIYEKL